MGGIPWNKYMKGKKMLDIPDWISATCAIGSLVVAIIALRKADNTEAKLQNIIKSSGAAGINQSGGKGYFNIGDMKVGNAYHQLASKVYGVEDGKNSFSELSNQAVKEKALVLAEGLRTFADKYSKSASPFSPEFMSASQEKKEELWLKHSKESEKQWTEMRNAYNRQFKIDTLLLREELLNRLPRGTAGPQVDFEDATTAREIDSVADDLERLAKLLKT